MPIWPHLAPKPKLETKFGGPLCRTLTSLEKKVNYEELQQGDTIRIVRTKTDSPKLFTDTETVINQIVKLNLKLIQVNFTETVTDLFSILK